MRPTRRRPSPRALLGGLALLAAAATAARAQAPAAPREVADQPTAWLMYFGDHAVSGRWALHAEAQVRRAEGSLGAETWQQLLLRPGLVYTLTPGVRLTAGYAYVETWPYGEQPVRARFPEHRLWQQAALAHGTGRVQWQHRYRFEQRWVRAPLAAGGSDRVYTNRGRYLLRATVPLRGRQLAVGAPYVSAYDEVFVNWGRNVQRNVFDQNRLYGAVGWRLTPGTRLEAGYLQQLIAKGNGVQLERNHSLQVAVFQSSPLRR
jgi:hypothetical protein